MSTYFIHESNMERLEKKMLTIRKKCEESHCVFTYIPNKSIEYRTCTDAEGNEYTAKYFEVEVSGEAKYNGWRFVATLDHHEEGNVIRAYDTDLVIPEKYKTCGPTCEHCNKIRSRKDTYLIYNDETKEFKQVGKSCLREFTSGLSAEDIAFFCSIYEKAESYGSYSGPNFNRYIDVEGILRYAFECYKHWGYQKSRSWDDDYPANYRSTKDRVSDYYWIKRRFPKEQEEFKAEMEEVGFDPESNYAKENAERSLEWIRNLTDKEIDNEYIRNLHVICSDDFTDYRSLGILVSLTTAYERHLGNIKKYEEKQKKQEEEKKSEYFGEVGQKVEVETNNFALISSWDSQYGTTYLYKFTNSDNNLFIWYASKYIEDPEDVILVKGTIKDHSEYNGVKQTVMTRCKVEHKAKDPQPSDEWVDYTGVADAVEEFLNYCKA